MLCASTLQRTSFNCAAGVLERRASRNFALAAPHRGARPRRAEAAAGVTETLAQRLRRLRDEHGYTLADLAAAVGCSEGALRVLENGRVKSPSLLLGVRLADRLHVDRDISRSESIRRSASGSMRWKRASRPWRSSSRTSAAASEDPGTSPCSPPPRGARSGGSTPRCNFALAHE